MKNFSSDIQLIIQCCQHHTNSNDITSLISKIMDWETFIDLAFSHGVFPLVYKELKQYPTLIPQEVLNIMKTYNMGIVKQNMIMTAELIKVMRILEENNIEALAFKGPTLAKMAYGDITLRQYSDLDILIQSEDIQKSYQILSHYYSTKTEFQHLKNSLYRDKLNDIEFLNKTNNILIELHWNLFQKQFSNNLLFTDILRKNQKTTIQNYQFTIFSNEILLVYLCMHGSKHCWERISWILDIDKIIRNNQNLDWNFIEETAQKLQCQNMLHLGLSQSVKFFNTPISYSYKINPKLDLYIEENFESLPVSKTEFSNNYNAFKFHYTLQDTFRSKVKYLIRTLLPINAQDVTFIQLPNKLYFLYYIIKPFRLFLKYIKKVKHID